jgi:hypothetical protein
MFKNNDVVKVKDYQNDFEPTERNASGRLGIIIAIDHPSTENYGNLAIVLFPVTNGLEEKVHRSLRFFFEHEVEPALGVDTP